MTTKGVWPEKDEMAGLIIPQHLQERLEQYRCFYLSLNPQRRVAWMHRCPKFLQAKPKYPN